jgi:hypothetical protein
LQQQINLSCTNALQKCVADITSIQKCFAKSAKKNTKRERQFDTQASSVVPHRSTDWASRSLASQIGRDTAFPAMFDRIVLIKAAKMYLSARAPQSKTCLITHPGPTVRLYDVFMCVRESSGVGRRLQCRSEYTYIAVFIGVTPRSGARAESASTGPTTESAGFKQTNLCVVHAV